MSSASEKILNLSLTLVGYLVYLFSFMFNSSETVYLFVAARMAATLFVQPLDLVKNRMQLSGKFSIYIVYCSMPIRVLF